MTHLCQVDQKQNKPINKNKQLKILRAVTTSDLMLVLRKKGLLNWEDFANVKGPGQLCARCNFRQLANLSLWHLESTLLNIVGIVLSSENLVFTEREYVERKD